MISCACGRASNASTSGREGFGNLCFACPRDLCRISVTRVLQCVTGDTWPVRVDAIGGAGADPDAVRVHRSVASNRPVPRVGIDGERGPQAFALSHQLMVREVEAKVRLR